MDENNINNEDINNSLDSIFDKLKKYLSNQDLNNIPGITPEQLEELKALFSNFDEIKNNIKVEVFKLDPFTKSLITSLMGSLSGAGIKLGDLPSQFNEYDALQQKEAEVAALPNDIEKRSDLLDEIDKRLSNPDLNDEEMNELLDKRMKILDGLE
jgi:hypothetical protein